MIPFSCGGYWLLRSDAKQKQIFQGQQDIKRLVACKRYYAIKESNGRIHPVMVRSGQDCNQDHRRVHDTERTVEDLPKEILSGFVLFKAFPKYAGMVDQRAADDEGVSKMHTGHGSQTVDMLASLPE